MLLIFSKISNGTAKYKLSLLPVINVFTMEIHRIQLSAHGAGCFRGRLVRLCPRLAPCVLTLILRRMLRAGFTIPIAQLLHELSNLHPKDASDERQLNWFAKETISAIIYVGVSAALRCHRTYQLFKAGIIDVKDSGVPQANFYLHWRQ